MRIYILRFTCLKSDESWERYAAGNKNRQYVDLVKGRRIERLVETPQETSSRILQKK